MTKISFVALTLLTLACPAALHAGGKTTGAILTAVSKDSITVRTGAHAGYKIVLIENNGLKNTQPPKNVDTFLLKPWTTIKLNGLPAKLQDLKPGMKVDIKQGTDPKVAESIIAVVVPPPQKADATDKTPPAPKKGPRKLSQGVDAYKVTALTPDTITVAQDGGKKSIAYRVGKFTVIKVNGKVSPLDTVKVGMEVLVVANTDPTLAASIRANDPD